MRFILFDNRNAFRSNMRLRLMIDDDRSVEMLTDLPSSMDLLNVIKSFDPDTIVVADNVFIEQHDWNLQGITVIGYRTSASNENCFEGTGIPYYDVIGDSTELLDALENGAPAAAKPKAAPVQPVTPVTEDTTHTVVNTTHTVAPTAPAEQELPEPVQQEERPLAKERLQEIKAEKAAAVKSRIEQKMEEKKKASIISVYAAKGGVGKTTIACELAVYLASLCQGRGRYRVCLVDYNIDFGDVLTTLNFDAKGRNMSHWAYEIRMRITNGEDPSAITFTKQDLEDNLQRDKKTGLYALIAPVTHEDSMDIESDELDVMLRNLAENGDFDFIVCDTGNNTRDSSIIALEAAETILLISTQDVSTVSCNDAFISTMRKLDFDTSKIKLVINNIVPYKYSQVSVQEVEQMFPYPCVARINRNMDVLKANNCCEPLVFDSSHEFTKEIRNIAKAIVKVGLEEPEAEHKGKFKLFGRGKKK